MLFHLQLLRNALDRANVRRHVLTDLAVAARCSPDERPVLVRQRDRNTVDLQLAEERRAGHSARDAVGPRLQLFPREAVIERVHACVVLRRRERF